MRVAAVQMRVSDDSEDNIERAGELMARAANEGAELIALPECFVGRYGVSHVYAHGEVEGNSGGSALMAKQARELGAFIIGGIIEKTRTITESNILYKSMPAYGPVDGPATLTNHIVSYRKVHLSRTDGIPSESDAFYPGTAHVKFQANNFNVGMASSFDLRFPQWLSHYGPRGFDPCDLLLVPSAFLNSTGPDHWDTLVKRTALDSQCYVAAPNIAFDSTEAHPLHGNTMVVDPYGKVIAQCGREGDDLAIADVCHDRVKQVREEIPLTAWLE